PSRVARVSPARAPVSAPPSISISRSAAKPIISRRISASGVFSTSERRFIISSVIGCPSDQGLCCTPTLSKSADHNPAAQLHHVRGHDLTWHYVWISDQRLARRRK